MFYCVVQKTFAKGNKALLDESSSWKKIIFQLEFYLTCATYRPYRINCVNKLLLFQYRLPPKLIKIQKSLAHSCTCLNVLKFVRSVYYATNGISLFFSATINDFIKIIYFFNISYTFPLELVFCLRISASSLRFLGSVLIGFIAKSLTVREIRYHTRS